MEPLTATPNAKPAGPHGARGSLDSPEVYENVPGHVIPILRREFDDFDTESAAFLRGDVPEDQFIGFRLKQGVYGQRQAERQMIRVKLPLGGVTPEQMEAFADAIERYVPLQKGHITTRQNIQVHHVTLPDAAQFIREISDSGLSSREGCGNTMRNVTGDPWAGVCEGELFDPTAYAGAYVRYFVRNEVCQLMPRKFKTAFTATDEDRAITGIHDGGYIPRVRVIDGREVRGFELRIGGGTSIMPRIAPTLYEFVRADDGEYLKVMEAALRIFNRQDDLRKNRARARIKVLVDRVGIDEFRAMVEEELRGDWVNERDFDPAPLLFEVDEQAGAPPAPPQPGSPNGDRREFDVFVASNVRAQRQQGFVAVEVNVTRGDLSPEQFRGLAAIMRDFSGGYARTTIGQNLVMRWVREESVYDLWRRLGALELGAAGAREIDDVISCPGTDSCKLGITSSMGLNQAVRERLAKIDVRDAVTRKVHVHISGCPNGCGQHHLGDIGFTGASIKVGEHTIPAYIPHIAGRYDGGQVVYGTRLKSRLPAKRVPDAVERWVAHYEANRADGELFRDFVARVGTAELERIVKDLAMPAEFGIQTMNEFIDWSRAEPFQVIRGEGECASLSRSTDAGGPCPRPRSAPEEDLDAHRRGGARAHARAPPSADRAGLLLPEGGERAAGHAAAHRAGGARVHDRYRSAVPRDIPGLARDRAALRRGGRGLRRVRSLAEQATEHVPETRTRNPAACCAIRKVERADARALDGLDAWITGLRREQAPTRTEVRKLDWDGQRSLWKANPLADWSERDVWNYIFRHDLPYNTLHDQGYASIGCAPCTLPGAGREGRWAGSEKTEMRTLPRSPPPPSPGYGNRMSAAVAVPASRLRNRLRRPRL